MQVSTRRCSGLKCRFWSIFGPNGAALAGRWGRLSTVVASEYAGKVKVGKVDVDANGNTAMRYNVRGIPTLLLFKGGQVVEQRVGAIGKSDVQKMIDPHV
jgi:hypothetical protein